MKLQTVLFLFFSQFCALKSGVRLIYGCGFYRDVYGTFSFTYIAWRQPCSKSWTMFFWKSTCNMWLCWSFWILLDRLTKVFSLQVKRMTIDASMSMDFSLDCSVPQGSCMGPLWFVIFTSSLLKIIESHLPQVHCYADDTWLYLSFRPAQDAVHRATEVFIKDIQKWISDGRQLLNDTKTEFMFLFSG